jgi:hypothetical protein
MDDFVTIYYWVRLAVLVAVALIALITAIRMSGRRVYRPWREVLLAVLVIVVFAGLSLIVGVYYSPLWAAVLAVIGLVLGFFVNRGVSVSGDGRVRPSPLGAWLWCIAVVLAAATLLFAESYVFELAMLVLAFAAGVVIGQTAGLMSGGDNEVAPAPAPEADAA